MSNLDNKAIIENIQIENKSRKYKRLSHYVFDFTITVNDCNQDFNKIEKWITDSYYNYLQVNRVKRKDDLLDENIKNIFPKIELLKKQEGKIIFYLEIKIDTYTVLLFNFSNLAN